MDYRIPLAANTILEFDGMQCHVESVIGCGSNAVVYQGWYPDRLEPERRHRVLIKELFPLEYQGRIRRSEDNQIIVEAEAAELWQRHKESFLQGNKIHLRMLEDHPDRVGANLNSFEYANTLYSVLGFTGGRSLLTELTAKPDQSLREHVKYILGLLDALEAFHKSGYLHLDISPDNIMLSGTQKREHIFLIDFNSARLAEEKHTMFASFKAGYSAPEVETGEKSVGFASDLYSVAAVFYRCLMGRSLTLSERLRSRAPDGSDSLCIKDQPQTVTSMVGHILRKGLHPLPQRRFRSIGQMRQAFLELQNRIDGIGVTHWALWENGRRSVEWLIRRNPSLQYISEEEQLYPIRLQKNKIYELQDYLTEILSPNGKSGLILANGGMGKTTLLLHSAMLLSRQYSPSEPAVFYLSLENWNAQRPDYICGQILARLRFKPEENTYESAKHTMMQLLSQPLKTRDGPKPVLLILLDGLNEARGDIRSLLQEIRELSAMAGVRILGASRSELPELPLEPAELIPLQAEDIGAALGNSGLYLPRDPEILRLLQTPLILSAFIQAGTAGVQPEVHNEAELMQAYLSALAEKELRQLPEGASERWQIEAVLQYVLPGIADAEKRKGGSMSQQQLLRVVQRCWKALNSTRLRKLFPQWIGHSHDILGDAKTSEEWYGQIIHQLLWQRMGLLLRDSNGNYRVFHQTVREHLAELYLPLKHRIQRTWLAAWMLFGCVVMSLFLYGWSVRLKQDEDYKKAIDYGTVGYVDWGYQYAKLRQLTDDALQEDQECFFANYDQVMGMLSQKPEDAVSEELYRLHIEQNILPEGNQKVSWSSQPFQCELSLELVSYASESRDYYRRQLPVLASWMVSEDAQMEYPELIELFSNVLQADAKVAGELYHQVCAVHLDEADLVWQQGIRELIAMIPEQENHRMLASMEDRKQYLENLRTQLALAKRELTQAKAGVEYSFEFYLQTVELASHQAKILIEEVCGEDTIIVLEKKEELMELARHIPTAAESRRMK